MSLGEQQAKKEQRTLNVNLGKLKFTAFFEKVFVPGMF
jgi:hypothetical protein